MSVVVDNSSVNPDTVKAVVKIVTIIRYENDYAKAAITMQDKSISLVQLTSMTLRLSIFDIAKLGDELSKI